MLRATSKFSPANRKFPTLVAVGSSLAALPAAAFELGDLTVHSRLGQPLRASIAYVLAPNERLTDLCVSLRSGSSTSGLPNVGRATIKVADGTILLAGNQAIREPIVSAHVMVNCPYTANISREYMLFVDPAAPSQQSEFPQPVLLAEQPLPRLSDTRSLEKPRTSVGQSTVVRDISKATRYRVQPGDSLSKIVQRIENRPMSLWPAVNAIFDANPDAFLDNDPNKLKAGSWLFIPSFDGSEAIVATAALTDATTSTAEVEIPGTGVAASEVGAAAIEIADIAATPAARDAQPEPTAAAEAVIATETMVLPGTRLEGPTTTSASPNVPTASLTTKPITTGSQSVMSPWMLWLAGSGVAIILGLLLFGRRLRKLPTPAPLPEVDNLQMYRSTDVDTYEVEAIGVDYDLTDDSPTEENLALDADLFIGTGLDNGADLDFAQEFGFADSIEPTVELPFEPEPTINEAAVFSTASTSEQSILESEVFPDDDHYDMSVIIDATKMPQIEDATEFDLRAVEVDTVEAIDESMVTDAYTINDEADFRILEQDYEDEMTATQALNKEITRAAAKLAENHDNGHDAEKTSALPLAEVIELDVTAQLPANDEDPGDWDDTGINETLTVNIAAEDETAEMCVADNNDETIEMTVESGKVG